MCAGGKVCTRPPWGRRVFLHQECNPQKTGFWGSKGAFTYLTGSTSHFASRDFLAIGHVHPIQEKVIKPPCLPTRAVKSKGGEQGPQSQTARSLFGWSHSMDHFPLRALIFSSVKWHMQSHFFRNAT